ncbi:DegT/DnrJ/EryC1/StrS family aminotransferase [Confluentibacter citreus]|uniref:DegT/DnrJ/EryC1/StrS family aminotransferase n=1 Tax=Confluentibacter citreus TaxID=2007307 RepID=UPI000C2942E6|nr:DegT/DnrJ/EryC1/StrS family aminotransferase [Confluentibacter citreus]
MINFLDLKKINAEFDSELKEAFDIFLKSGRFILGDQVSNFEVEFANYCGAKYCIGVSNGLDALRLIFEAYKTIGVLNEGDEIIVPSNTYIASILSISSAKLKPVLVEPDVNTYNIDVFKLESVLTSKTKAILGVHLYGQLYKVIELERFCEAHGLILIEDAAQAHGAVFLDGRKAGNVSDAAAFSFYPTKNLGALGDAGAITTNNSNLADVIFKLRNYGKKTSDTNDIKGYNCRLDELQAAFLLVKLKQLDFINEKRRRIATFYLNNINSNQIILPECKDIKQHVFHLFVIRSKSRNRLKEYLFKNGVETLIHYPIPIHLQKAYSELNELDLPITNKLHDEVLSIPLNQSLEADEIDIIVSLLSNFK